MTDIAMMMRQTRLNFDGVDEHFCLDDHVLIGEQVNVRWTDGPDESVCLDDDVEVDDSDDRDVIRPIDADVIQQMVLCKDVVVNGFCLDACGRWVAGFADADVVQHMVFS